MVLKYQNSKPLKLLDVIGLKCVDAWPPAGYITATSRALEPAFS
jgi:hypothetical protein